MAPGHPKTREDDGWLAGTPRGKSPDLGSPFYEVAYGHQKTMEAEPTLEKGGHEPPWCVSFFLKKNIILLMWCNKKDMAFF